jgi:hypothetical protein
MQSRHHPVDLLQPLRLVGLIITVRSTTQKEFIKDTWASLQTATAKRNMGQTTHNATNTRSKGYALNHLIAA